MPACSILVLLESASAFLVRWLEAGCGAKVVGLLRDASLAEGVEGLVAGVCGGLVDVIKSRLNLKLRARCVCGDGHAMS